MYKDMNRVPLSGLHVMYGAHCGLFLFAGDEQGSAHIGDCQSVCAFQVYEHLVCGRCVRLRGPLLHRALIHDLWANYVRLLSATERF